MEFDAAAAIGAGLIGGAVMALMLYMDRAMMPAQMRMDLFYLLGTMTPMPLSRGMVYMAGALMHAGASVVFGLAHAGVFDAVSVDADLAAWGLLFGAVHWMIAGMALGMMPMLHPGVRAGRVADPGPFAVKLGPMTAMGFLILHLVFGVLVGALYEAWA